MNIGDRLGKNHPVVRGDLSGAIEFVGPKTRPAIRFASTDAYVSPAMTDEELAALSAAGVNEACEVLLTRYVDQLRVIAKRGANRHALELDDCFVLARLGLFKATISWSRNPRGPFRQYMMSAAVGELRKEAFEAAKSRGWRRVAVPMARGGYRSKLRKFAIVVSDDIPTTDGGSLSHSDFVAEKYKQTEQIGEIIAAEQASAQHISAWQLVKDGEVLAAFLKALPPAASKEAARMMRGMTIEESMLDTGLTKSKVSRMRATVDDYAEEWNIA